jgi:signal transduction histidine kinase
MRVSTKIVLGYAILIALMVGAVAFQLRYAINPMQDMMRELSGMTFVAGKRSQELMRDRDLIEEYATKYFVSIDSGYLALHQQLTTSFWDNLNDVEGHTISDNERAAAKHIDSTWSAYLPAFELERKKHKSAGMEDLPPSLRVILDQLKAEISLLYRATMDATAEARSRSLRTQQYVRYVTVATSSVVLLLSFLVSYFIVRSISKPLAQLTEGTRYIASGQFSYRLEASRNDEFAALAKDFNAMALHLNELDEMKKDFVSHVSHELKAPLASIQEAIQLMLEELPGPLTEKQRRLLELNLQSARRLSDMIGKLLDLSRMEAGVMEYELQNKDLSNFIRTVVAEYEPQAVEKGLRLSVLLPEEPLSVHCDGDRMIQVLSNLLANAIKFTPNGGYIEVRAQREFLLPEGLPKSWRSTFSDVFPENGFLILSIADSGPGVADEFKERVFEKFQKGKNSKRLAGQGAGLGLAICRTIIQAHRGAIWVEDNPGGGSMFRLLLRAGEDGGPVTRRESLPI